MFGKNKLEKTTEKQKSPTKNTVKPKRNKLAFLMGLLLFLIGGGAIAASFLFAGASVISISENNTGAENSGNLVYVSGTLSSEKFKDDLFNIEAEGTYLERVVEMYQWVEEGDSFVQKWSPELIVNSSDKATAGGFINPNEMPIQSKRWDATDLKMGAFSLSEGLLSQINNTIERKLTEEDYAKLSEDGRNAFKLADGTYFFGLDPANPRVGDFHVKYNVGESGPVTILAKHSGSSLSPYISDNGRIEKLKMGNVSLDNISYGLDMGFGSEIIWGARGAGGFFIFISLILMLKRGKAKASDDVLKEDVSDEENIQEEQHEHHIVGETIAILEGDDIIKDEPKEIYNPVMHEEAPVAAKHNNDERLDDRHPRPADEMPSNVEIISEDSIAETNVHDDIEHNFTPAAPVQNNATPPEQFNQFTPPPVPEVDFSANQFTQNNIPSPPPPPMPPMPQMPMPQMPPPPMPQMDSSQYYSAPPMPPAPSYGNSAPQSQQYQASGEMSGMPEGVDVISDDEPYDEISMGVIPNIPHIIHDKKEHEDNHPAPKPMPEPPVHKEEFEQPVLHENPPAPPLEQMVSSAPAAPVAPDNNAYDGNFSSLSNSMQGLEFVSTPVEMQNMPEPEPQLSSLANHGIAFDMPQDVNMGGHIPMEPVFDSSNDIYNAPATENIPLPPHPSANMNKDAFDLPNIPENFDPNVEMVFEESSSPYDNVDPFAEDQENK